MMSQMCYLSCGQVSFKFRLTDAEYLELLRRAAAAGMSASAYVRHKALYEEG